MVSVRVAKEGDVDAIREIFVATYGPEYPYQKYYNVENLKKIVYSDDTVILVAEEDDKILGTASVIVEVGAFADLSGEFGRLAVHPDARGKGVGQLLMQGRIAAVQEMLHIAISEPRVAHPFSQKIAEKNGFVPVGYLAAKHKFTDRESVALFAQYFSGSLKLRRNNPRIISSAYLLADTVFRYLDLPCDAIVSDEVASYPSLQHFDCREMSADGYASLLRFERGRFRKREIFGPTQLHYGLFKIRARKSTYLLALDGEQVVGGVGFTYDELEESMRIFELVSVSDEPICYLLSELDRYCKDRLEVKYVEVDVNAYAPEMQKTLANLGFNPVAYIPAMVFHQVERLDVVKMVKLYCSYTQPGIRLTERTSQIERIVRRGFAEQQIAPEVNRVLPQLKLLHDLDPDELARVASLCCTHNYKARTPIFSQGDPSSHLYVVLGGEVEICRDGAPVGRVEVGGSIGELSALREQGHSVTAIAEVGTKLASIDADEFRTVLKQHPGISIKILKNLACELGEKLTRTSPTKSPVKIVR